MRLFVEATLEASALDAVWQVGRAMSDDASFPSHAVRWVKRDATHLTLRFLGEVAEGRSQDVIEAMSALDGCGRFSLRLDLVGAFGGRRPRVIWVGLAEDQGLEQLRGTRRRLDEALDSVGFAAEAGPFRPHLTLGRVRRQASRTELASIRTAVDTAPTLNIVSAVARVALVESTLFKDGPRYQRLAVTEL